ncbi:MAG: UvrD-helicase domain-containing protein [Eubacteriales bacterium]
MEYTEKQKHAINARGASILVSAAAGSGKTSVLTSRIVDLIAQGADIRRMLVATFTNAAAGEMKTRIARALSQLSQDRRVREQADFVFGANIGTFHSICSRIMRENYNLLGISPGFKILSDHETQILRRDSMEELLDDLYAKQDADFLRLVDRYVRRGNDDGIAEMVYRLHDFTTAKPDPTGWLSFASSLTFEEYLKNAGEDSAAIRDEYAHTMPDVVAIAEMTKIFGEIFSAKKKEKSAADYADLLHGALQVLKVRRYDFDYIFVDEYQDTNPVQEEIIRLLAGEDNLFMVGDIKQSIYKFNLADPDIFLQKAAAFKNPEFAGELVCMNENFRCAAPVVNAVNGIMEKVMSLDLGEIEYSADEQLICKNCDSGEVEVLLALTSHEVDKNIAEATLIADKICSIVGQKVLAGGIEKELKYGDIALLVRSRNDFVDAVKRVFYSRNIPLVFDLEEKRDIPELDLFVNVLRVIENAQQDVPLISALRSHAGGLDENGLASIRLIQKEGPFHLAAKRYAVEKTDDVAQKVRLFYEKLEYLRVCAVAEDFTDFIRLAADTFCFTDFMRCISGEKSESFSALLELCAELGESSGGSLYMVNRTLLSIKKREGSYARTKPVSGGDAVRLMTMHHAKGLEFPVVFLCSLQRQFVMRELFANAPIVIHSDLGILPNYVDEEKCISRPTAARNAAVARLKQEFKSEDLRILYVALTRAKQNLYLCGSIGDADKSFAKWDEYKTGKRAFLESGCMLDWVMGAIPPEVAVVVAEPKEESLHQKPALDMDALSRELIEAQYPPKEIFALPPREKVPAKLSVSEIKKQGRTVSIGIRAVADEGAITGAKLGTLVHAIMEHINFENDTALVAAQRLFVREIITLPERDAIADHAEMIDAFFETELAKRIRNSPKVIKETPFNLLVPANEVGYMSGIPVTVQGVLDLAFMEGGQWILVDYKTDRVQGDVEEYKQIYVKQLALYADALEKITGIPVSQRYLCFLRNNLQVIV